MILQWKIRSIYFWIFNRTVLDGLLNTHKLIKHTTLFISCLNPLGCPVVLTIGYHLPLLLFTKCTCYRLQSSKFFYYIVSSHSLSQGLWKRTFYSGMMLALAERWPIDVYNFFMQSSLNGDLNGNHITFQSIILSRYRFRKCKYVRKKRKLAVTSTKLCQ